MRNVTLLPLTYHAVFLACNHVKAEHEKERLLLTEAVPSSEGLGQLVSTGLSAGVV